MGRVTVVYVRPDDRVEGRAEAIELLRAAPFVQLVSGAGGELAATGLPMLVDETGATLVGHLARANRQWRDLDGAQVLVIAPLSDGYVSPDWYRSKVETGGKAVPTWNYEVVHVHGRAQVHDDAGWLRQVVDRLSDHHEALRSDTGERWSVADAPPDYIDQMLRAIVGVSVTIDRIQAKAKLSSNRSIADQRGVADGLAGTEGASTRLIASTVGALKRR